MTDQIAIMRFVFQAIRVAPTLIEKAKSARGRPSSKDRGRLVAYCRRLNERRVLHAPFRDEIVESCLASLSEVRAFTDETLSQLSHPMAQAALGAILDEVRSFLDKWQGARTPQIPFQTWSSDRCSRGETDFSIFLQDLGALREKMRVLVSILAVIEPNAIAPELFEGSDDAGRLRDTSDLGT